MSSRLIQTAVILAVVLPIYCTAQPSKDARLHYKQQAEIREKVQTMKIWKMTEELQLSQEQATRFFPILNEMENDVEAIEEKRKDIFDQLGKLVWSTDSKAAEIEGLIDKIEALEAEQLKLRKEFHASVSDVLEPVQMGRMILFNHQFPKIMREMIRDLEDRRPPRPEPAPKYMPPQGR